MNKTQLIEAVADRLGRRAAASAAVDVVFDVIARTLAEGQEVRVTGFGVFERVDRAARRARNPRTNTPMPVAATQVPKFRPGQPLLEVVSGVRPLPGVDEFATRKRPSRTQRA